MMEKIQKFGGAMFTPVMLFAISAVLIGFGTLFTTEQIMGSLAAEGTIRRGFWDMILSGGWTVFNQLPLLFAVSLPIGLADKQNARACMESLVIYLIFNYYISSILQTWGPTFGVDYSLEVGADSGLANIAGIKTLDMGMMGALLISGVAIHLHNKYFNTRLPEWLGVFRGSAFVVALGFLWMIPAAFLACLVWPKVQGRIGSFQHMITSTGGFGIWIFILLERLLIPFGLHHLLYSPLYYDNVLVPGGIYAARAKMLPELAASSKPLVELAPFAAFTATGRSKIFGCVGIAFAFYKTARDENKKKVAGLMIPVAISAVMCGVTEPIEYTFLFVAPGLFVVHAVMAACLSTIMYYAGVVGVFSGGVIEMASLNRIPLMAKHGGTYLRMLIIGVIAIFVWYFVFKFLIEKFDLKTPGRTASADSVKLYSKAEYREKKGKNKEGKKDTVDDEFATMADQVLIGLGGAENIKDFTNCVTRLRVNVYDPEKVESDEYFREIGTYGTSRNNNSVHVIIGTNVQFVADEFGKLMEEN